MKQWAWVLCLMVCSGYASAERLDDSASPRAQVKAPLVLADTGGLLVDSIGATRAILKFGRVDYKLATAPYVGRDARIYYVIPAVIPGLRMPTALSVEWQGSGLFASGVAHPGERVQVWSGRVGEEWINEGLDLTMRVDLRELDLPQGANFGFESYFEIEVLP